MGQMTGIRYPNSAEWLTYEYDKMGRLAAIPGFAGTKNKPGFRYDENSALQLARTDNGIVTTYKRDKNGRIIHIKAAKFQPDTITLRLKLAVSVGSNNTPLYPLYTQGYVAKIPFNKPGGMDK